ncbi:alpha/beta hydrolase [Agromyces protaetiae]|uniref:Alpha/beta hydrolase n=1 Tax=Agromyces protaetiae TaxID=2509455 RepID=A0A4P6FGW2_9MICO|nr:alpha/beta hydrolase [Agromyces protaetiae]QAY73729.1 alpha/beta hydrolase [Agromyces protaetiae]
MPYSPIAATREFAVQHPTGRRIQAYEAGDPTGELVIMHHGTPGSGTIYRPWADDALARGIRLVAYDRPGFGGSDEDPGRSVARVASDTAAVADALGVEKFRCWGPSGGGPHALACAALLPDRVVAVAAVASLAPWDAPGLDWLNGMGATNADGFVIASESVQALRERLERSVADDHAESFESISPAVDVQLLEGEIGTWISAAMARGLTHGIEGWIDDLLAFVRDWEFDVESITAPTLVLHGRQDLSVPVAHGEWLADRIPGATRLITGDGHASAVLRIGADVHAWLMAQPA